MSRIFMQTDGTAPCGRIAACSGATMLADAIQSAIVEGGTPGTTEQVVALPTNNVHRGFMVQESPAVGKETWDAGDWVTRFNVTTAQADTVLRAIHVCRVNESCGTVHTVASETGLAIALSGGGVFTRTINAPESTGATTDRIYIVGVASNTNTHTTRNVGITPNQDLDTPITPAGEPVSSTSVVPLESVAGAQDSRALSLEALAATSQAAVQALESLAASRSAATLHAEALAAPLRSLGISTESLARAVASGAAPVEWLTGVLVARGVSIEAAGVLVPPALLYLLEPTLDGPSVAVGDGTMQTRTYRIPAGEYATPFWLVPDEDSSRASRINSLPYQTVLRAGRIRVQSTAP